MQKGWKKDRKGIYQRKLRVDGAGDDGVTLTRADLLFFGVDHSGPSFEVRIYFNNTKADWETPCSLESGFAGRFSVFSHAGCGGNVGHCDVVERKPFDPRREHHMKPHDAIVVVTKAMRHLVEHGKPLRSVTVVPVSRKKGVYGPAKTPDLLRFDRMTLRSYEGGVGKNPEIESGSATG